ncbi:MAG TPA: hypothetical protein VG276_27850 [Actinomycetes bacterium]|jgi:hypothetical protein|nr:hypothetical protein [Actinomycetes bacterium]
MQSASGALATAILGQERRPVWRLRVDWNRSGSYTDLAVKDLSADVVDCTITRELSTDLPDAAKLFAGSAAASATITLAHGDLADPSKHTAWYYSPANAASPLAAYKRRGAPATLEVGFVGSSGPEYLPALVGSVRTLEVSSGGRTATLQLVDRAETMRQQVTLPMIVADGETAAGLKVRPGLRTTFLADWIFRQSGYYSSPPARSGCRFLATMHGSAWPEIGIASQLYGVNGLQVPFSVTPEFPSYDAKFVQATITSALSDPSLRYLLGSGTTMSANNGAELLFEGWFKLRSTAQDQPLFWVFRGGSGATYASLYWQTGNNRLVFTTNRGLGNGAVIGPTVTPGTSSWHYIAVQASFTSTGVDVTFRYDGTTTGPTTIATSSVTGAESWDTITLDQGIITGFATGGNNLFAEAVQLTTESTISTWNDGFVPTVDLHVSAAIDSKILAVPPATEEAWSLLQTIAGAEFATTGFDETGRPFWWPRDRWTTPPYTTSQRTLSSTTALEELATVEAVDQVRNKIVIRASQPQIQPSGIVWRSVMAHPIPTSGRTLYAQFDNPVANLDTSVAHQLAGGSSRYLASTARDGVGGQISNLGFTVTPFATSALMAVTNPNGSQVYLVADDNDGGTTGAPYLILEGQFVLFDQSADNTRLRVEVSDATSISDYGEQLFEVPDNPFRQDPDQINGIAADLLTATKQPGPAYSNVTIVADPRLQLADRVTVQDPGGLEVAADAHLSRIELTLNENGMRQTVNLRSA